MYRFRFRCKECGLVRTTTVRLRFANENLDTYLNNVVGKAIFTEHRLLSPFCPPQCQVQVLMPCRKNDTEDIGLEERPLPDKPF